MRQWDLSLTPSSDCSHSPELLPHQDDLIARMKEAISDQEARIEELGPADGIARSLYEMEIERVNFQLRSYLRTRLEKISRMAIWTAQRAEAEAGDEFDESNLLAPAERRFLEKYLALYQEHIDAEAWASLEGEDEELPVDIKKISTVQSLLVKPDTSAHVFCKALRACDPFTLPGGNQVVELKEGDVFLLPYEPIRHLLLEGSVQLT